MSATTSSLTLQRRFAVGWLRGSRLRATITSLILGAICLVWTYPFLWMVSAALKTNVQVASGAGLIPPSPQWGNFERAWTQAHIGQYFTNTVIITVSTVAIVVAMTAMMGYALGRYDYPGRKIVLALYAATIFIPEGYTIIPVFDLINRLHLNDTLFGIILAEAGGAHVIFVLLFAGFFSQLPHELEEAAIVDGAGFVRTFAQVMLPLSGPVIATTIILQFMSSWNNFMLPLVLTLSRPELRTLGVGVRFSGSVLLGLERHGRRCDDLVAANHRRVPGPPAPLRRGDRRRHKAVDGQCHNVVDRRRWKPDGRGVAHGASVLGSKCRGEGQARRVIAMIRMIMGHSQ